MSTQRSRAAQMYTICHFNICKFSASNAWMCSSPTVLNWISYQFPIMLEEINETTDRHGQFQSRNLSCSLSNINYILEHDVLLAGLVFRTQQNGWHWMRYVCILFVIVDEHVEIFNAGILSIGAVFFIHLSSSQPLFLLHSKLHACLHIQFTYNKSCYFCNVTLSNGDRLELSKRFARDHMLPIHTDVYNIFRSFVSIFSFMILCSFAIF